MCLLLLSWQESMDALEESSASDGGLRAVNARLRQLVARQAAELDAAQAESARLRTQVDALTAQVAEQSQRIEQLTGQVTELQQRLGRNSKSSSMPPSAEGLAKKPAVPRKRGQRRPGKQPGAQGRHLAQVAAPDEVVVHAPQACGGCGGDLGDAEVVGQAARQVFDLPEIRLWVVEHRTQRRRCPGCKTVTAADFPAAATAPACYGPGVRAGIAYLCVAQHLPIERAAQTLSDLLGAPIAAGTIANVITEAAEAAGVAVDAIAAQVAAAQVAHFDETGARVAGRGHWVHSASTPTLSHFTVHPKRGKEAMDAAGVLGDFKGVAVHDGWASYRGYDVTHGLCNAHHLRELQAIAEQGTHQDWAGYLIDTLVAAHRTVVQAKADGQQRLGCELAAGIRARYLGHVAQGRQANPRNPNSRKQTDAFNLLERLAGYVDDVLRFTVDFRVPFDNNQAERDIRMVKLQQKVSGGWRTLTGAQAFMAVRSYIATARKQGVNVLHVLRRAFENDPWLPAAASPPAGLAAAA